MSARAVRFAEVESEEFGESRGLRSRSFTQDEDANEELELVHDTLGRLLDQFAEKKHDEDSENIRRSISTPEMGNRMGNRSRVSTFCTSPSLTLAEVDPRQAQAQLLRKITERLQKFEEALEERSRACSDMEAQKVTIAMLHDKISAMEKDKDHIRERFMTAENDKHDVEHDLHDKEENLRAVEKRRDELEELTLGQEKEIEGLHSKIEELELQIDKASGEKKELQTQKKIGNQIHRRSLMQRATLNVTASHLEIELVQKNEEIEKCKGKVLEIQQKNTRMQVEREEANKQHEDLKRHNQGLQAKAQLHQQEIRSLRDQIQCLQENNASLIQERDMNFMSSSRTFMGFGGGSPTSRNDLAAELTKLGGEELEGLEVGRKESSMRDEDSLKLKVAMLSETVDTVREELQAAESREQASSEEAMAATKLRRQLVDAESDSVRRACELQEHEMRAQREREHSAHAFKELEAREFVDKMHQLSETESAAHDAALRAGEAQKLHEMREQLQNTEELLERLASLESSASHGSQKLREAKDAAHRSAAALREREVELQSLQQQLSSREAECREAADASSRAAASLQSREAELKKGQEQLDNMRRKLADAEDGACHASSGKDELKQIVKEMEQQLDVAAASLNEREAELKVVQAQLADAEGASTRAARKLASAEDAQCRSSLGREELKKVLQEMEQQLEIAAQNLNDREAELKGVQAQLQDMQARFSDAELQACVLKDVYVGNIAIADVASSRASASLVECEAQLHKRSAQLQGLQQQLGGAEDAAQLAARKHKEHMASLETAANIAARSHEEQVVNLESSAIRSAKLEAAKLKRLDESEAAQLKRLEDEEVSNRHATAKLRDCEAQEFTLAQQIKDMHQQLQQSESLAAELAARRQPDSEAAVHALEQRCRQLQEHVAGVMDAECAACTRAYHQQCELQGLKSECQQLKRQAAQVPKSPRSPVSPAQWMQSENERLQLRRQAASLAETESEAQRRLVEICRANAKLEADCKKMQEEAQIAKDSELMARRAELEALASAAALEPHPRIEIPSFEWDQQESNALRKEAARVTKLWQRACHWLQEQAALVIGMERMAHSSASESCVYIGHLRHQCEQLRAASVMPNGPCPAQVLQTCEQLQLAVAGIIEAEEATYKCVEVGHCENSLLQDECKILQQHAASVAQMEEEASKLVATLLSRNERLQSECAQLKQDWRGAVGEISDGSHGLGNLATSKLEVDMAVDKAWESTALDMSRIDFKHAERQFKKSATLAAELRHILHCAKGSANDSQFAIINS